MKTILIAASLLMVGASVYGIVDYHKNQNDKAFQELYKEQTAPAEVEVIKDEQPTVLPVVEKKETAENTPVPTVEKTTKKIEKKRLIKPKKEERVFRFREFSRGRLG